MRIPLYIRLLSSMAALTCLTLEVQAQDIEKIIKTKKPVQVNGALGLQNVLYYADGISARRNAPFQYYANGSLNFTFFEQFSVPLSFSYSNQKLNYSRPFNQQQFNQFGVSPKYKWITAHAGWRNMTFSPYTLSGHTFLGGGTELSPGKFKIKAMYGRLRKAVEMDTTESGAGNVPSYLRMGGGASISYADKGNHYDINLFSAKDQISSLSTPADSVGLTPEENYVWGAALGHSITPKLKIDAEYSRSVLTRDTRVAAENNLVIRTNGSTVRYNALKGQLNYKIGAITVGAGYERIDPGYRTLGGYFFNNDLENITANFATSLMKQKINLNANIGSQRNNLDKSKVSTMRRWIGALNLAWNISKKVNFNFGYSSFQTYTNIRSQFLAVNTGNLYQNLDTLNYVQISQSFNVSTLVKLSADDKKQQMVNLTGSLQKADDQQGGKELNSGTAIYNANVSYTYTRVKSGFFFSLIGMGNWNDGATATASIYGPSATMGKTFFKKKLRSDLSSSWNLSDDGIGNTSTVLSVRSNHTLTLGKRHSFTMGLVWLQRSQNTGTSQDFQEFNGRLGYNLRF